jgi:hypothetical protein
MKRTTSLGSTISIGLALTASVVATGCGGPMRFADRPPVWQIDDRKNIPEPEEIEFWRLSYFPDVFALRRSERALAFKDLEPARNTNSLDEVPDSSWFENRIGLHDLTAEEVGRGPIDRPPPRPPYKLLRGKTGGGNAGFVVEDAAKRQFLIKFDRVENPEMQTGTNTAAGRLVWAFGFKVPRDYIIDLKRDEITIPPDATAKDGLGDKIKYEPKHLEEALATSPPPRDGVFRATASELIDGKPKGGWPNEGVRDDDPNDVVPHQHRRELRGLRVLSAWINHTDMKDDNTFDTYVEQDGRKYLEHYLIDFGEAFGGHAAEKNRAEDGYENFVDYSENGKALLALGLWKRPWEYLKPSPYKAVGWFTGDHFDPEDWKEAYPYWPFWAMDRADAFWGAKIVMRFRREHIRAAIEAGKFTEPGAAEWLVKALEVRRDAIGRTWLEGLSALDRFEVKDGKLCATDLGILYGLARAGVVERLDDGDVAASATVGRDAKACVAMPSGAGYQIVTLRVRRGDDEKPEMQVHVVNDARPRVLGLVRDLSDTSE